MKIFPLALLVASSALAQSRLPACQIDSNIIWNNCQGTITSPNGDKYVGEFQGGKQNGQGTILWADGISYVGEFKDGLMQGRGTLTWPEGRKYVGEFYQGKMTGKGTLFAPADQSTPVVVGNFSYDELARNPARHIGAPVSFSGKVVQALKNGRDYTLRVNVSRGQFNIWKDTVFVEYHTGSAQRILEEDIIDFRGKFAGIKSYTTVLGATVPIPYVIADAIKDNGREDVQSPQWKTPETIVTKGYCRSLRISVGECDACTRRMTNQQCDEFKQKREECSREGWWLAEIGPVRKYVNPYVDPCPE